MNYTDKIICCIKLRWVGNRLEQFQRIQRSYEKDEAGRARIEIIERWEEVEGRHRKRKYDCIDWDSVDWSQSDNAISRQFKISPTVVRSYRIEQDRPAQAPRLNAFLRQITPEQIASADWDKRDIEIARDWKVTGERVRQIRQLNGRPRKFSRHEDYRHEEALNWIEAHRAELEGKHVHDAARMVPTELNVRQVQILLGRAQVKMKHGQKQGWKVSNMGMDWSLPNTWLSRIWDVPLYTIANARCALKIPASQWVLQGFTKVYESPSFKDALLAEVEKAIGKGIAINKEQFISEFEELRQIAANRKRRAPTHNRPIGWKTKPIRTCRKPGICKICGNPVELGVLYYDALHHKAHIGCVNLPAEHKADCTDASPNESATQSPSQEVKHPVGCYQLTTPNG